MADLNFNQALKFLTAYGTKQKEPTPQKPQTKLQQVASTVSNIAQKAGYYPSAFLSGLWSNITEFAPKAWYALVARYKAMDTALAEASSELQKLNLPTSGDRATIDKLLIAEFFPSKLPITYTNILANKLLFKVPELSPEEKAKIDAEFKQIEEQNKKAWRETIEKAIQEDIQLAQKAQKYASSGLASFLFKFGVMAGQTIGTMGVMLGTSVIGLPQVGKAIAFGSTYALESANAYLAMIDKGVDWQEAVGYAELIGLINGYVEVGMNKMVLNATSNKLDDVIGSQIYKAFVKKGLAPALSTGTKAIIVKDTIISGLGEAEEEFIQDAVSHFIINFAEKKTLQQALKEYFSQEHMKEVGEQMLYAFLWAPIEGVAEALIPRVSIGKQAQAQKLTIDYLTEKVSEDIVNILKGQGVQVTEELQNKLKEGTKVTAEIYLSSVIKTVTETLTEHPEYTLPYLKEIGDTFAKAGIHDKALDIEGFKQLISSVAVPVLEQIDSHIDTIIETMPTRGTKVFNAILDSLQNYMNVLTNLNEITDKKYQDKIIDVALKIKDLTNIIKEIKYVKSQPNFAVELTQNSDNVVSFIGNLLKVKPELFNKEDFTESLSHQKAIEIAKNYFNQAISKAQSFDEVVGLLKQLKTLSPKTITVLTELYGINKKTIPAIAKQIVQQLQPNIQNATTQETQQQAEQQTTRKTLDDIVQEEYNFSLHVNEKKDVIEMLEYMMNKDQEKIKRAVLSILSIHVDFDGIREILSKLNPTLTPEQINRFLRTLMKKGIFKITNTFLNTVAEPHIAINPDAFSTQFRKYIEENINQEMIPESIYIEDAYTPAEKPEIFMDASSDVESYEFDRAVSHTTRSFMSDYPDNSLLAIRDFLVAVVNGYRVDFNAFIKAVLDDIEVLVNTVNFDKKYIKVLNKLVQLSRTKNASLDSLVPIIKEINKIIGIPENDTTHIIGYHGSEKDFNQFDPRFLRDWFFHAGNWVNPAIEVMSIHNVSSWYVKQAIVDARKVLWLPDWNYRLAPILDSLRFYGLIEPKKNNAEIYSEIFDFLEQKYGSAFIKDPAKLHEGIRDWLWNILEPYGITTIAYVNRFEGGIAFATSEKYAKIGNTLAEADESLDISEGDVDFAVTADIENLLQPPQKIEITQEWLQQNIKPLIDSLPKNEKGFPVGLIQMLQLQYPDYYILIHGSNEEFTTIDTNKPPNPNTEEGKRGVRAGHFWVYVDSLPESSEQLIYTTGKKIYITLIEKSKLLNSKHIPYSLFGSIGVNNEADFARIRKLAGIYFDSEKPQVWLVQNVPVLKLFDYEYNGREHYEFVKEQLKQPFFVMTAMNAGKIFTTEENLERQKTLIKELASKNNVKIVAETDGVWWNQGVKFNDKGFLCVPDDTFTVKDLFAIEPQPHQESYFTFAGIIEKSGKKYVLHPTKFIAPNINNIFTQQLALNGKELFNLRYPIDLGGYTNVYAGLYKFPFYAYVDWNASIKINPDTPITKLGEINQPEILPEYIDASSFGEKFLKAEANKPSEKTAEPEEKVIELTEEEMQQLKGLFDNIYNVIKTQTTDKIQEVIRDTASNIQNAKAEIKQTEEQYKQSAEKIAPPEEVQKIFEEVSEALKHNIQLYILQKAYNKQLTEKQAHTIVDFLQDLVPTGTGLSVTGLQGLLNQLQGVTANQVVPTQLISEAVAKQFLSYVFSNYQLTPFEKLRLWKAVIESMVLGERVLRPAEASLIAKVMGKDVQAEKIMKVANTLRSFSETVAEILSIPKLLMASADDSMPFRQGVLLIGHPKLFLESLWLSIKALGSTKVYEQSVIDYVAQHPLAELAIKSGLAIQTAELEDLFTALQNPTIKQKLEKIPFVKMSERSATAFLYKARLDYFSYMYDMYKRVGIDLALPENIQTAKAVADFVNVMTGWGDTSKVGDRIHLLMNAFLFSPRLMVARLAILNPWRYINYAKNPALRPLLKEMVRMVVSFVAFWLGSLFALRELLGEDKVYVELDPRSADFLKARIGLMRIDVSGGFSAYIRTIAQVATGTLISSNTLMPRFLGTEYGRQNKLDVLMSFFQGKSDPVISFILDAFRGVNFAGEEINQDLFKLYEDANWWDYIVDHPILSRFTPMIIQDFIEACRLEMPASQVLAGAVLSFFGFGVQSYGVKYKDTKYETMVKNLHSQGYNMVEILQRVAYMKAIEQAKTEMDYVRRLDISPEEKQKRIQLIQERLALARAYFSPKK